MIKLIAAIGINNELGKNGDLIWRLKGDLLFFKNNTINKVIVMGKKTFTSLPHLLKDRKHVVFTKDLLFNCTDVIKVSSLDEFFNIFKDYEEDIMVIGGESIYKIFLPYADELIITRINASCKEADVYFPKIDDSIWDNEVIGCNTEDNVEYKHIKYIRRNYER